MDAGSVAALKEIVPALVALAVCAGPVLWYWIKKSHDLRVKELELENDARVHELEKRLARAEGLLAASGHQPERAELYEAPPQPARTR